MDPTSALLLVAATAVLVAIPGPNVALFVANTLSYGARYGVATVLGTTFGVALQLAVVVFGLVAILQSAAGALLWLKWAGAAYLIILGLRSWRMGSAIQEFGPTQHRTVSRLFLEGLILALINPKTLVFIAAFLPQFVDGGSGASGFVTAACLYVTVVFVGDLVWVFAANALRPWVARLGRLQHRLSGALFLCAGFGLAASRATQ